MVLVLKALAQKTAKNSKIWQQYKLSHNQSIL